MFPLRLSPFEESFLLDDHTGSALDILLGMELRGEVDRQAFELAFRQALERHPLLQAQPRRTRSGRYEWVLDNRYPAELLWREVDDPTAAQPSESKVYATDGVPTRVIMQQSPGKTHLTFHCHHTRTDGAGVFQFLGDLLIGYARRVDEGCAIDLPSLDARRLRTRSQFGLNAWRLLQRLPKLAVGVHGIRQFVTRKPAVLVPTAASDDHASSSSASTRRIVEFSIEATAGLRATAKRHQASLNDLLARDLFLAIRNWRLERGFDAPADWLRLMVPINMRSAADAVMSAANVVSTVYLDRQPQDCLDPSALLQGIRDEMQLIKDKELGLIFVLSLAAAGTIPGGIGRLSRGQDCLATAVFTNLMRPIDHWALPRSQGLLTAGNLTIESLDIYAPLRRRTLVSCATLTYADRLRWCLRFDREHLSEADIDSFVAHLRNRINASTIAQDV